MKQVFAFVILYGFVGLVACHKKNSDSPRTIPQGLRDYWDFKEGTWWVYQDSMSGKTDTSTVCDNFQNGADLYVSVCRHGYHVYILPWSSAYGYFIKPNDNPGTSVPNAMLVRNEIEMGSSSSYKATQVYFIWPLLVGGTAVEMAEFPCETCTTEKIYSTYAGFRMLWQLPTPAIDTCGRRSSRVHITQKTSA